MDMHQAQYIQYTEHEVKLLVVMLNKHGNCGVVASTVNIQYYNRDFVIKVCRWARGLVQAKHHAIVDSIIQKNGDNT